MKRVIAAELTDEQMEQELKEHFAEIDAQIEAFLSGPVRVNKKKTLKIGHNYFERCSIQKMWDDYLKYFNRYVKENGYGFEYDWDEDDMMHILYKNGTIRTLNPAIDDGKKKVSIDNIDSIILNGSWGTAVAGPTIIMYNRRETVPYRPEDPWGYRDVKERYNDFDDIRADFYE